METFLACSQGWRGPDGGAALFYLQPSYLRPECLLSAVFKIPAARLPDNPPWLSAQWHNINTQSAVLRLFSPPLCVSKQRVETGLPGVLTCRLGFTTGVAALTAISCGNPSSSYPDPG